MTKNRNSTGRGPDALSGSVGWDRSSWGNAARAHPLQVREISPRSETTYRLTFRIRSIKDLIDVLTFRPIFTELYIDWTMFTSV